MAADWTWSCKECSERGRAEDTIEACLAYQEHYALHHLVQPTTPPK